MLRVDGRCRPDDALRRLGITVQPMALLEINGRNAWILASSGVMMVRIPVETVKDGNPDVAGPLGVDAFSALRAAVKWKLREFYIQADVNFVELYDDAKRPVCRVPRGFHPQTYTDRMREVQHPAWEYPLVVGVKPAQLAQVARAMGAPDTVFLHIKPEDGTVREPIRVSAEAFGVDGKPHGYLAPTVRDVKFLRSQLESHATTAETAGRIQEIHPWFEPVRPVEPVR